MSEKDEESFPSARQAFLVLIALFLAEYLAYAALHDFRRALTLAPNEVAVFATLFGNAAVFVVLMHMKSMSYADLFHPSPSSVTATVALLVPPILLLVPALVLVAGVLTNALTDLLPLSRWEEQAFQRMSEGSLPSLLATCVLAPILEEMLFRGVILRAFLRRYPAKQAVLMSALFFGFAHLNIYQFVVAFLIGSLAAWLYLRSRSLLPCIALHAAYNSSVALAQLHPEGYRWRTWVIAVTAAALGGLLLRHLLSSSRRHKMATDMH